MAVKYYFYFLLVPFLKYIKMNVIQNTTEIEEKSLDLKSHLELPKIKKICSNRDVLCRSNNAVVCTLKYVNNSSVYKMFKNACYLFLSNMCDNPGEEFYILSSGTCEDHFGARRNNENNTETTTPLESTRDTTITPVENNNEEITPPAENNNEEATTIVSNSNDEATTPVENANDEIITQVENNNEETTTAIDNSNVETTTGESLNEDVATTIENSIDTVNDNETTANSEDIILRQGVTTPKPTEPITETETADGRPCPISCPKIYDPVCVNVNRGFGKYFKLFMFVNRCMYDLYYCRHPVEFDPPPNEDYDDDPGLSLQPSPLGMSYCAASRYLQFARFAEVTSSMAHYGWLTGNYRYSHIMEPYERLPGHG